jgi:serine protease AprX
MGEPDNSGKPLRRSRKSKPKPEAASSTDQTQASPSGEEAQSTGASATQPTVVYTGAKSVPTLTTHGSRFDPEQLDQTTIAIPLLKILRAEDAESLPPREHAVIIDLNLGYPGTRDETQERVIDLISQAAGTREGINESKTKLSDQYVFARLTGAAIRKLVELDRKPGEDKGEGKPKTLPRTPAIYRIWPDFEVGALVNKSISTVKADAARISFSAYGANIVWAIVDSGIDDQHPHFKYHKNLKIEPPIRHRDFTAADPEHEQPCKDDFGHGTHVAGIIAGEIDQERDNQRIHAMVRQRDEAGNVTFSSSEKIDKISGMAPQCKLLSLKVLDEKGRGSASSLMAAITYIQQINGYGRHLRIHGVNMSVGYPFDPEWFACGQSPLCVEVDRLVRSGVVVVAAAGNTGYGWLQTTALNAVSSGMDLTINDPGNAELAITVGSTHRNKPHIYGVSYFSSKGPTGDGRRKPDLVAPGEKIISCATGNPQQEIAGAKITGVKIHCDYREDSGTSMAAPHVSGVIAAFLSVRQEYIGRPEEVKEIFLSTATDLKREQYFQGHGLVDLMRAIQSV